MAMYDEQKSLALWRVSGFGYKTKNGSTTESIYYIKDHISNIRVTVDEDGDIVTKDDYYPFGLQMPGLSYNDGNTNDRFKFSGKELDQVPIKFSS